MLMRCLLLLLVCLCCAGSAVAATPERLPTYTVRKGDTLLGIARKTGVKAKEIQRLNRLRSHLIQPGQVLVLGSGSRPLPRPAPAAPPVAVVPASTPVVGGSAAAPAPVGAGTVPPAAAVLPVDEAPVPGLAAPVLPQSGVDLQQVALAYLATPYRFGAETRQATDCSGFTQQVFRECGLDLPRTAREQFAVGTVVPEGEWQIGDLLFFRTYARYPSHVGIYLGDGRMIHASRSQRKVVISSVERPYFRKRYLGARRVAWFDPVATLIDNLAGKVEEVNDDGLFEADLDAPPDPVEIGPPAPALPTGSPQARVPTGASRPG